MDEPMITEWCSHCDNENTFQWNVEKEGFVAFCPHCGEKLMLCDECLHCKDNPNMECNDTICSKRKAEPSKSVE